MSEKHAYLIMAHTDFPILLELIGALDDIRNDIYIHIDKKTQDVPTEEIRQAVSRANVYLINRMCVNWGGFSQIECELELMRAAAAQDNYSYYHLLTGQTYPLKDQNYIHEFFRMRHGKEFIGFDNSKDYSERVRYIHLFSETGKATTWRKKLQFKMRNKFIQLQKLVGYERKETRGVAFQKGFVYWSLTDKAIRYLLSKEELIRSVYKHSTCADEVFSHTILFNSEFKSNIYNLDNQYESCLRYIKPARSWGNHNDINKEENSVTVDDLESLKTTQMLFGLKFCGKTGLDVIHELKVEA